MVPSANFKALSNDLLNVSHTIVQQAERIANAHAASQNPASSAPSHSATSVSMIALATPSPDTTANSQAAKRQATFLKKATEARSHHATNEFSRALFHSVMGRNPNQEEPK